MFYRDGGKHIDGRVGERPKIPFTFLQVKKLKGENIIAHFERYSMVKKLLFRKQRLLKSLNTFIP